MFWVHIVYNLKREGKKKGERVKKEGETKEKVTIKTRNDNLSLTGVEKSVLGGGKM